MQLEQPGTLGGLTLKNRVVMAPMGTNYSTTDGLSTARDVAYYAERARGGVGAIMTEAMVVTQQARPHHNSLCCYHDRFIPGLASIVEAIQAHDCRAFAQLNHRGALLRRSVLNMEPVGPSDWINPNTGDAVRALLVESGAWTALRTRPYSRVPSPDAKPSALFITAIDSGSMLPISRSSMRFKLVLKIALALSISLSKTSTRDSSSWRARRTNRRRRFTVGSPGRRQPAR